MLHLVNMFGSNLRLMTQIIGLIIWYETSVIFGLSGEVGAVGIEDEEGGLLM